MIDVAKISKMTMTGDWTSKFMKSSHGKIIKNRYESQNYKIIQTKYIYGDEDEIVIFKF